MDVGDLTGAEMVLKFLVYILCGRKGLCTKKYLLNKVTNVCICILLVVYGNSSIEFDIMLV